MYCIAPFSSLVVDTKTLKPCCAIQDVGEDNRVIINPALSITENFIKSNKRLQELFLSDDPDKYKDCVNCTQVKPPSQNVMHNNMADENIDYIATPTLTSLHLKASNFCNLACRICNPMSSNLIAKEQGDLGTGNKKYEYSAINENTPALVSSIIDQLPKLKMLWLSGGEPLINPENWQILQAAYDNGHSKNISLHINTNGTFMLSDEQIDIFNSFKKVELHVSLDGVDEVGEYIRTNLKVDKWIENVRRYKEKLSADTTSIGLVYSVSVFNITRIRSILKLAETLDIMPVCNYVHSPEVLSIKNMNDKSKEYVNKLYASDLGSGSEIDKIVHYMNLPREIDPIYVSKFIDNMDNNVIKKGLYNNYKPFKEVDTFWYYMLKIS
jgi:MoaA/NifB/PqqE/SkfB family radical SAM enzyme